MSLEKICSEFEQIHSESEFELEMRSKGRVLAQKRGNSIVYDLGDTFSVMFWRLFPIGDLIAEVNFSGYSKYPYKVLKAKNNALHRHNYLEISYVYKGSFCQTIDGEDYVFSAGDIWIMDRGCMHSERLLGYDNFVVFFDIYTDFFDDILLYSIAGSAAGQFIREAIKDSKNKNRFIHFSPQQPDETKSVSDSYFSQLVEEKRESSSGSMYIIKGLLMNLFDFISKNYSASLNSEKSSGFKKVLFNEVSAYVYDNCADISLEKLSSQFSFSKSYFSRLITKQTGLSFMDYLHLVRLEKAINLLSNTRVPVKEVAGMVGYLNQTYFYKLFSDKYGTTPAKYRRSKLL